MERAPRALLLLFGEPDARLPALARKRGRALCGLVIVHALIVMP
jgi:hypothetical protein